MYGFGLAHEMISDLDYTYKMYSTQRLMLDNGCDELGEGLPAEQLAFLMGISLPKYVVLPDVLRDADRTIQQGEKMLTNLGTVSNWEDFKFIAVAQGKSRKDLEDCAIHWINHPKVKIVGLPYDIDYDREYNKDMFWKSDTRAGRRAQHRLETFLKLAEFHSNGTPFHFFGCSDVREFTEMNTNLKEYRVWAETHDSTYPYSAAQNGVKLKCHDGIVETGQEKDWRALKFDEKISDRKLLKWNLQCYLVACGVPMYEWSRYSKADLTKNLSHSLQDAYATFVKEEDV